MVEMGAMIKTELSQALANSMWGTNPEPSEQLRSLQTHQQEMCAAADKVIQDMKDAWSACLKAQLEMRKQMDSRMVSPRGNAIRQQNMTEYALRHLDANVQSQTHVTQEIKQTKVQQRESINHLDFHHALEFPGSDSHFGPSLYEGAVATSDIKYIADCKSVIESSRISRESRLYISRI